MQIPKGGTAGTGAWTTDWPTKAPLAAQPTSMRGCEVQTLYIAWEYYQVGLATRLSLVNVQPSPKGYPSRNPHPVLLTKPSERTKPTVSSRVQWCKDLHHPAALRTVRGPTRSLAANTGGNPPECNANDRTPQGNQPTWKDHQRGVLGFSPPLLPCSNRTPRASRDRIIRGPGGRMWGVCVPRS